MNTLDRLDKMYAEYKDCDPQKVVGVPVTLPIAHLNWIAHIEATYPAISAVLRAAQYQRDNYPMDICGKLIDAIEDLDKAAGGGG